MTTTRKYVTDGMRILIISVVASVSTLIISSFINSPKKNEITSRNNAESINQNTKRIEAVENTQKELAANQKELSAKFELFGDKMLTKEEFNRSINLILQTIKSK